MYEAWGMLDQGDGRYRRSVRGDFVEAPGCSGDLIREVETLSAAYPSCRAVLLESAKNPLQFRVILWGGTPLEYGQCALSS